MLLLPAPARRLLPQTPQGWALAGLGAVGVAASAYALWPVPPRVRVVRAAQSQLGRSNAAPYWADVLPGVAPSGYPPDWCGAFALWTLHQAGLARDLNWVIGQGFLDHLPTTQSPLPGDIAYFTNNQHQAVVTDVSYDGTIGLVNGNGTAGAVSPSETQFSHVAAFYSIEPLLASAESDSALPWILGSAVVLGAGAWVLLPRGNRFR